MYFSVLYELVHPKYICKEIDKTSRDFSGMITVTITIKIKINCISRFPVRLNNEK